MHSSSCFCSFSVTAVKLICPLLPYSAAAHSYRTHIECEKLVSRAVAVVLGALRYHLQLGSSSAQLLLQYKQIVAPDYGSFPRGTQIISNTHSFMTTSSRRFVSSSALFACSSASSLMPFFLRCTVSSFV